MTLDYLNGKLIVAKRKSISHTFCRHSERFNNHLSNQSCALYTSLQDGVSITCVFLKHLNCTGITHVIDNRKSMHGLWLSIETPLVSEEILIPTAAQVLGRKGIKATKQSIPLDLDGLRKCTLSMNLIGGVI